MVFSAELFKNTVNTLSVMFYSQIGSYNFNLRGPCNMCDTLQNCSHQFALCCSVFLPCESVSHFPNYYESHIKGMESLCQLIQRKKSKQKLAWVFAGKLFRFFPNFCQDKSQIIAEFGIDLLLCDHQFIQIQF